MAHGGTQSSDIPNWSYDFVCNCLTSLYDTSVMSIIQESSIVTEAAGYATSAAEATHAAGAVQATGAAQAAGVAQAASNALPKQTQNTQSSSQ